MCTCSVSVFSQEQEENKGATSWPEYYIDQLNSMAAVSISQQNLNFFLFAFAAVFSPALFTKTPQNPFALKSSVH